jgi:Heavy metal binding domain
MKANHVLKAIALAVLCVTTPLNSNLNAQTAMASKTAPSKKYSCSHHPDKISDKPEKCACGMDLVEVKEPSKMAQEAKPMMKQDSKKMDKSKMKDAKSKMKKKSSKSKDATMEKTSPGMKSENTQM